MEFKTSTKSKTEAFEPVHLEEGIYEATLDEVKDVSEGKYGERVAFIYNVQGNSLALVCYKTVATKDNKLGQTLLAHGAEMNDENIDTESLPNKQVRAWVETITKEREKEDGSKENIEQSVISKVKPLVEKVSE